MSTPTELSTWLHLAETVAVRGYSRTWAPPLSPKRAVLIGWNHDS